MRKFFYYIFAIILVIIPVVAIVFAFYYLFRKPLRDVEKNELYKKQRSDITCQSAGE